MMTKGSIFRTLGLLTIGALVGALVLSLAALAYDRPTAPRAVLLPGVRVDTVVGDALPGTVYSLVRVTDSLGRAACYMIVSYPTTLTCVPR